jgi:hypothetical protein
MNLPEETFLTAHLDGELPPDQRLRVEAALVSDPGAAEDLRALACVRDLVAGLSRPAIPFDVSASVVARIEKRRRIGSFAALIGPSPATWAARLVALSSAAAAIVATSAVVLLAPKPEPQGPPPFVHTAPARPNQQPEAGPLKSTTPLSDVVVQAHESPSLLPDPGREREAEQRHIRRLLDSPDLHKVFVITDVVGDAERRVSDVLAKNPRRQASFGRITVKLGVIFDPEFSGEGNAFVAVVEEPEFAQLRTDFKGLFGESFKEADPRPELLTQLADIGQVSVLSGTGVAELVSPSDARNATALRVERRGGIETKSGTVLEIRDNDPLHDPSRFVGEIDQETLEAGPTPEQERSGPHPSLRPGTGSGEVIANAANARDSAPKELPPQREPGGANNPNRSKRSVVLVLVSKPPRNGSGVR